jgi:hypothetical protein
LHKVICIFQIFINQTMSTQIITKITENVQKSICSPVDC